MNSKHLGTVPYNPGLLDLVREKQAWSQPRRQQDIDRGFLGWHENGYLPHRDVPGLVQFVTFRLADAFPNELRGEWESLVRIENDRKRRIELERYMDMGRGACHLKRPKIARIIEDALLLRHGEDYELRAWVIMPNHVHILFKVHGIPMSQLLDAWKGYTAKQANKVLGRRGKFWQDGYWDTFMRDLNHESRAKTYIESNPVKARLAASGKKWPWGSARLRDDYGRLCLQD
jgi:REP element-mobilizing transposase RayT